MKQLSRTKDPFKWAEMRLQLRYTLHFTVLMTAYWVAFWMLGPPHPWRARIIPLILAFVGLGINFVWLGVRHGKLKKMYGK